MSNRDQIVGILAIAIMIVLAGWAVIKIDRTRYVQDGLSRPMPRYTVCTPDEMAAPPANTVCLDGG